MVNIPLEFESSGRGNVICTIDLDVLYANPKDRQAFEARWIDFLDSDKGHGQVLNRNGSIITYPHKSWVPIVANNKPAVLFLFGNPAPHSVVAGIERLFGRRAIATLLGLEKARLRVVMQEFLKDGGAVIAMQKDAYNAVAGNVYNLKLAAEGELRSEFAGLPVYGTPPTRWLYTAKMKDVLVQIRAGLLK